MLKKVCMLSLFLTFIGSNVSVNALNFPAWGKIELPPVGFTPPVGSVSKEANLIPPLESEFPPID